MGDDKVPVYTRDGSIPAVGARSFPCRFPDHAPPLAVEWTSGKPCGGGISRMTT